MSPTLISFSKNVSQFGPAMSEEFIIICNNYYIQCLNNKRNVIFSPKNHIFGKRSTKNMDFPIKTSIILKFQWGHVIPNGQTATGLNFKNRFERF